MKQTLVILRALRVHGELKAEQLLGLLADEFDNRKHLSATLGNMKNEGLIVKSNPGLWSMTGKGRDLLESVPTIAQSLHPRAEAKLEPVPEAETPRPTDLLSQLQQLLPDDSSLVVEASECFFVFARQRFAVGSKRDLQTLVDAASLWIGEVA
ncbi:hypothetical protein [Marinobacter sp. X15-166B]|uniref:hypothetical protein n=1 Tax=Marinobacter sp. X15-166B TaxID=1897620 RepID=UPI00085C8D1A|nr:hypothetical protein [Marinobacter sp. X15-166B]OEY66829.1 hypothetical protein BG841_10425 [Marinobacter sp. X15-166B]